MGANLSLSRRSFIATVGAAALIWRPWKRRIICQSETLGDLNYANVMQPWCGDVLVYLDGELCTSATNRKGVQEAKVLDASGNGWIAYYDFAANTRYPHPPIAMDTGRVRIVFRDDTLREMHLRRYENTQYERFFIAKAGIHA